MVNCLLRLVRKAGASSMLVGTVCLCECLYMNRLERYWDQGSATIKSLVMHDYLVVYAKLHLQMLYVIGSRFVVH